MYRIELMLYPKNSATISVDPFKVIAFCVAWRDIAQFFSYCAAAPASASTEGGERGGGERKLSGQRC